jgi:hypothetical protein
VKRHLNTLLQRKRAEFEGSSDMHSSSPGGDAYVPAVQVKDGYDWLQVIKQVREQHTSAH